MRKVIVLCVATLVASGIFSVVRPHAQSFTAAAGVVPAPDPKVPLYFETASVKPSRPDAVGGGVRRQPGGRFDAVNAPVRRLIAFAYQIQDYQLIGGPDWLSKDRFDIVAKMEGDPPPIIPGTGADHMMLAMRSLLADRFKLVVRHEPREQNIYALTLAKENGQVGPALKRASGDCSTAAFAARRGAPPPQPDAAQPAVCGILQGPGKIRFGGYPLSLFASGISNQLGRAVVDRTGLSGNWDFELTYMPQPPPGAAPAGAPPAPVDSDLPDLFTAVQEQLGLKFVATKGPVDVLVIDSVDHPTPD